MRSWQIEEPVLYSEFQSSLGYKRRSCLKCNKNRSPSHPPRYECASFTCFSNSAVHLLSSLVPFTWHLRIGDQSKLCMLLSSTITTFLNLHELKLLIWGSAAWATFVSIGYPILHSPSPHHWRICGLSHFHNPQIALFLSPWFTPGELSSVSIQ